MERPVNTRAVLGTVSVALLTVMSAVSGLTTALPDIAVDTGATQTQLTWIVDSYTVVFAGLLLLAGAIGDRYGRRRVLLAGLTIFAVTSALGLFVHSADQLIALRALSGVGAALIMPSTLSVITTSFPREERGKAIGVWVGVAGGGAILGLFATALLLERFSWNSFFVLNIVLAVAGLVGTVRFVPESRDESDHRLDWVGGLLSIVAVGALVFGIIEGGANGWSNSITLSALVLGVVALALFVVVELRTRYPLLDPRHFRDRGFSTGSLSITIQFFAQLGFVFVAVQYLQFVAGFTALEAALRLLPMAFIVIPASRAAGALDARVPGRYLGASGLLMLGAGLYLMGRQGVEFDVWFFWLGLGVYAFGVAFAATPATTWITRALPDAQQGVASAVNDTAREAGSAVGIAVLGSVLTSTYQSNVASVVEGLPPQLATQVEAGLAFSRATPPAGQEAAWAALVQAADEAFVLGMSNALTIGAGVAAVTAVVVLLLAPGRTSETLPSEDAARAIPTPPVKP